MLIHHHCIGDLSNEYIAYENILYMCIQAADQDDLMNKI